MFNFRGFFVSAAILFSGIVPAFASEYEPATPATPASPNANHVFFSVSESLPMTFVVVLAGAFGSIATAPTGANLNLGVYGSYTAGYERVVKDWLAVGGEAVVLPTKMNFTDKTTHIKIGNGIGTFFMVMPTAKFYYMRREHVELYGKTAIGVITSIQDKCHTETDGDGQRYLVKDGSGLSGCNAAFQVDPIGVRVGNSNIGGFLEVGAGLRGILNLGIEVAF
ncbi:MAG: hypothetical protein HUJ91_04255 [Bacteroidales bacterium]|nr:hypothetical protein [Bacteroidales bacterium]